MCTEMLVGNCDGISADARVEMRGEVCVDFFLMPADMCMIMCVKRCFEMCLEMCVGIALEVCSARCVEMLAGICLEMSAKLCVQIFDEMRDEKVSWDVC